jgi:hypothetical protein
MDDGREDEDVCLERNELSWMISNTNMVSSTTTSTTITMVVVSVVTIFDG